MVTDGQPQNNMRSAAKLARQIRY